MRTEIQKVLCFVVALLSLAAVVPPAWSAVLDENCVVNILNRTVQVAKDGGWSMPNVPSTMGRVRARATCVKLGDTFSGESDYFNVVQNGVAQVPEIKFESIEPVPVSLQVTEPTIGNLSSQGATAQLKVVATYRDNSTRDVTAASNGTNYTSTNPAIATVSAAGLVTAVGSGSVLITARKDEVTAFKRITVSTNGDADNDGLPDDFETANGLNPNDPLDAQEDPDNDGLTTLQEYQLGTNLRVADSDGDGISDGEEVAAGADGFVTDPLKADTDGDGVNDRDEILAGADPTDRNDGGGRLFVKLVVTPSSPTMTFNTVYNEANLQLKVEGERKDGSRADLTRKSTGTSYSSSNLSVVSFGAKDGLLFAGQAGTATVTVRNAGVELAVTVTVGTFTPTALSAISIPGYANNVDVAGDYAYVAAGSKGLQVLEVSNRTAPRIVGSYDTDGTAIDVRVVGDVVYLADGGKGLKVFNVIDPTAPTLLAAYETAGVAQDVSIDQEVAYIADGSGGLEIVDVRKPAEPLTIGQLGNLGEAKGVAAQGNTVVVVAGSSLHVIDVSDKANPVKQGSLSIGPVQDVTLSGNYAYVAAYSSGWKVVNISNPVAPTVVAGNAEFVPRDIELTDGFAFAVEQIFPNVVAYVNIEEPQNAVFQGTIDLSRLGDFAGTGIAIDSNFVYVTEESYVVSQDYGTDGTTKLFIAQYRLIEDKGGVAPTIEMTRPADNAVVVEGKKVTIDVTAEDDIGVRYVEFLVNGQVVFKDTSRPYQYPVTILFGTVGTAITVSARATDFGGNTAVTQDRVLTVEPDTDRDGLSDAQEAALGTNPFEPDSDGDGLLDGDEVDRGTDPLKDDTDGDGIPDGNEVQQGTDPLNPDTTPPTVAATDPALDAVDIPENSPVMVIFNEPLSAKAIDASSVRLYEGILDGAAPIAGRVSLSGDGLRLIFTPADLLADYTVHKVVVDGVKDRAGNRIAAPFSMTFTTGNTVDTTPPTVVDTNPYANQTGVPVNAIIGIKLSEPVKADTVTETSVLVHDNVAGETVPGVVSLGDDGQSITFVPNRALAVGRQHYIQLSGGIQDLFGNALSYNYNYFTTAFAGDAAGPQAVGFSLADSQTGVGTNAVVQVQFDEPVSGLSLAGVELRQGGQPIAVVRQLSADHRTVTLKQAQPLAANSAYVLHIEGAEDLSGNLLGHAIDRGFTTGAGADLTAPTLVTISPANGTTNVGTNTPLVMAFSERPNPLLVNADTIALYDTQTGQRPAGSFTFSADGTTVTFTPAAPLTPNRLYYVYFSNWAALYDQAGNALSWTYSSFTTGTTTDLEGPVVSGRNIADGATGIPVNAKVKIVLDEPVSDFSTTGSLRVTVNGSAVAGTLAIASDRRTLTFTPTQVLAPNTEYQVVIDGLYDAIGNRLAAITFRFTTGAAGNDTTGPTVTITPANGAATVSVTTPISLVFNEAIDPSTLDSGITIAASGFSGAVAGTLSQVGNTVTFSPLTPLPGNTSINVTVNGVQDLVGNNNSYRSINFTTGSGGDATAPVLVSMTPADGALDIGVNNPIVLTFSESLNRSTVTSSSVGLFINGDLVRPSISYAGDNRTITLTTTLPAASVVTVLLTSDIKDLSGNRLADTVRVFTTVATTDSGRPSIVTQLPGNSAYNVLPKTTLVLYSNEALDPATLAGAWHVSQNGVLINGDLQVIGDGRTLTFTPARPWANGSLIQVFLDSTAQDLSGNPFNSYQGQFRVVEDPAQTAPAVVALNTDDGVGLPTNPVIDLQFNEPLDPATVSSGTFVLHDYSVWPSPEIAASVSLIKGGRVVRIVPNAPLTANHGYYLGIRSGVKDLGGAAAAYNNDYYWWFTVGTDADGTAPRVLGLNPPQGATDIGINNRVNIRYDEAVNPLSFLGDDPDLPLTQPGATDARLYSLSFSNGNRQVAYIPHEPWPVQTDVTFTAPTAEDYAGNVAQSAQSTFRTANGPDTTAPEVIDANIASNAANVPVNVVIKVRMNKAIDPLTVNADTFYLYDTTTGEHPAATVGVEADGKTLTLVPGAALAVGRQFYFSLSGVQDLAGNSVSHYRYFTTALAADTAAPRVTNFSLADGQTGVGTNAVVQVQFDEPVSGLSLAGVELRLGGQPIAVIRQLSADHRTLTLRQAQPLAAASAYVLHIEGVEDLSGNLLGQAIDRSFRTGVGADLIAPTLVTLSPANGTTGVGINTPVVMGFSEALNPLLVNADTVALYDSQTGQRPAGTFAVSADGTTVTFTPAAALTPNRLYHVYIGNWATLADQAGNALSWTYTSFTTGP